MSLPSSRVLKGLSIAWPLSARITCRYKSTTSAIRAGLQAEQGGSRGSKYGRDRPGQTRSSIERSGRPSSGYGERARGQDYPSLQTRSPRSRDSPSRSFGASSRDKFGGQGRDRSSARPSKPSSNHFKDSRRPGRGLGLSTEHSSRPSFDQPRDSDRPRRPSTRLQTGTTFSRASRVRTHDRPSRERDAVTGSSSAGRDRQLDDKDPFAKRDYATDENGEPLPRKERRARFWADNAPTEEDEDVAQVSARGGPFTMKRKESKRVDDEDDIPMPIPYTTASSQFIYGANPVLAALRAERRKIYKLYMHKRSEADNIALIRRTASAIGVDITRTADTTLLDRISEGRPHNGVVLEVSAIPARPVMSLEKWIARAGTFEIELGKQDAEQIAVNGTETTIHEVSRTPLVVFLDGITDPGNVGNIIRTAYVLGAHAIAIAAQTCASLDSPVLAKASAGACEAIPIFKIPHASGFIYSSREQGWTICAAVAPADLEQYPKNKQRQHVTTHEMAVKSPIADQPCVLMLGAEGEGLRENLLKKADLLVTIPQRTQVRGGTDFRIDSLNVATAGALLIDAFTSSSSAQKINRAKQETRSERPQRTRDEEAEPMVQSEETPAKGETALGI